MSELKLKRIGVQLLITVSLAVSATVLCTGAAHEAHGASRPDPPRPAPDLIHAQQTDVIFGPGGPFNPFYPPTPPRSEPSEQGTSGGSASWPPIAATWPPDGHNGSNSAPHEPIVMPKTQPALPRH